MADIIFPTQITDWTPTWTARILFDDWISAKDCAISELPISTATQNALNAKQNTSEKWQANWYASLDWSWKVPTSQLPWWMGNWDVVWPNSSTNNAIARYSWTTWKLIKNSGATIDNLWNISATNLSWTNTWDETKATIESKLIWDISSHTHDWRYYTETETDTLLSNKVDKATTLTINWITYDLSADRSWTITAGASFNWINGQSLSFPWEIVPWKIAELTAFNSGTFNEMQIATLTRTTWTTTVSIKKNWTTIGTATITSATTATNGRYYGTSTDLADSFVTNDVITISVTDDWNPAWTWLLINLK